MVNLNFDNVFKYALFFDVTPNPLIQSFHHRPDPAWPDPALPWDIEVSNISHEKKMNQIQLVDVTKKLMYKERQMKFYCNKCLCPKILLLDYASPVSS